MVPQTPQTWRGRLSPGGIFSATGALQLEQNFTAFGGCQENALAQCHMIAANPAHSVEQGGQFGEAVDDVIGHRIERIERRTRAIDPEHAKTEGLRAAGVPAVG